MSPKPTIFIASSVEHVDHAEAVQVLLDYEAVPVVWSQGVFTPSRTTLADLLDTAKKVDFAAFVFAPDDVVTMRKSDVLAVRDNVIFELGVFIGVLGAERCFILTPRDVDRLHLPTDLLGVNPVDYDGSRENLQAALGSACTRLKTAMRTHGPRRVKVPEDSQGAGVADSAAADVHFSAVIGAWVGSAIPESMCRLINHADIDARLSLPPGTSARLTAKAVDEHNPNFVIKVSTSVAICLALRAQP